MKYLILILAIFVLYCNSPAQQEYYEIAFPLNKDGITYDYMMFIGLDADSSQIPFSDTLFTFPDSQWAQFLIGTFSHDSLVAVNPDLGIFEYEIQVNQDGTHQDLWLGVAIFARAPSGFYSDRAVAGPIKVGAYLRPQKVASITVTRKLRWK